MGFGLFGFWTVRLVVFVVFYDFRDLFCLVMLCCFVFFIEFVVCWFDGVIIQLFACLFGLLWI